MERNGGPHGISFELDLRRVAKRTPFCVKSSPKAPDRMLVSRDWLAPGVVPVGPVNDGLFTQRRNHQAQIAQGLDEKDLLVAKPEEIAVVLGRHLHRDRLEVRGRRPSHRIPINHVRALL